MFRQLNLFLAFLTVILIISPLAQARGRDGLHHRKETRGKRHQSQTVKGKHHLELTAEQRQAIETKVTEMKAAEADRSEIKKAVDLMLQGFGVELPERKGQRKHQHGGFFDQLTEEQKLLIDSKVKDMREAGANHKEIRKQVDAILKELGIEVPTKSKRQKLSSEQKAIIKQLLAEGASPTQIRQAVAELAIIDSAIATAPSKDLSVRKLRLTTLGKVKMNSLK